MEIRFMKQDALNTLKSSLKNNFTNYFTKADSSWLEPICDGNPFKIFRDVPDFELAPLNAGLPEGEIDLRNCKIFYTNLFFLTENQAADERLWAGLCHDVFYDYIRRRFKYDAEKIPENVDDTVREIKNRFFLSGGGSRVKLVQNPLARYWWTGRAFYDANDRNHFKKLDVIGANNFYTKIFSTLTRAFAANPTILNSVIKFWEHFKKKQIEITTEKHLRPALSELNKVGGATVLDSLSEDELAEIMIARVEEILASKKVTVINPPPVDDKPKSSVIDKAKIPVVETPKPPVEPPKPPVVDKPKIFVDDKRTVKFNSALKVVQLDNGRERNYKINRTFQRQFPEIFKELVGKKLNSVVTIRGVKCRITEIND